MTFLSRKGQWNRTGTLPPGKHAPAQPQEEGSKRASHCCLVAKAVILCVASPHLSEHTTTLAIQPPWDAAHRCGCLCLEAPFFLLIPPHLLSGHGGYLENREAGTPSQKPSSLSLDRRKFFSPWNKTSIVYHLHPVVLHSARVRGGGASLLFVHVR